MKYELIWTNRPVGSDCTTLSEMIQEYEDELSALEAMLDDGVELRIDGDQACLITDDDEVAEKYGFDEVDNDEILDEDLMTEINL